MVAFIIFNFSTFKPVSPTMFALKTEAVVKTPEVSIFDFFCSFLSFPQTLKIVSFLSVNLLTICFGAFIGWPSAALLLLQSEDSPLEGGPLTTSEVSWVGSVICIGALCGTLLFGWTSDRFGRKISMLVAVIPQLVRSCFEL